MENKPWSNHSCHQTLEEFFRELAKMEGWPYKRPFVGTWCSRDEEAIRADFEEGFETGRIARTPLNVGRMPPEAIGNAIASFVSVAMNESLDKFAIQPCPGAGLPDCKLVRLRRNLQCALEIKATSKTTATDSRVVLTSSSRKLRNLFVPPVLHLLVTAEYDQLRSTVWIRRLALNFLSPDTPVNVRFEAAVTTRLLRNRHNTLWIGDVAEKDGPESVPAGCAA